MLKSERKQFILEKVLKEKFVSLETLVQELGTSESTVRRDLDELEEATFDAMKECAPLPVSYTHLTENRVDAQTLYCLKSSKKIYEGGKRTLLTK